jgi:acetyl-CoA decarbonylase/synthase complex subunit delta
MAMELVLEKWEGKVSSLMIGQTKAEGGSRSAQITLGGEKTLPFITQEGQMPHSPKIALEVFDRAPLDWPQVLKDPFADVWDDCAKWAKKCVEQYQAELICLRFLGIHPDYPDADAKKAVQTLKAVLAAVSVPLIVLGCGHDETDNRVLPLLSEAAKGEQCLFGEVTQDNYKTLTASCLADGHNLICQSPIDVNIAKQLNILVSEMGFPLERIAINPTIGALGYGIEYAYSIMERARIAALTGDKMLAMPFICFVGQEAWRAKEAKSTQRENLQWGSEEKRGPLWEAATATLLLQAGADLLVMRHPEAAMAVRKYIEKMKE